MSAALQHMNHPRSPCRWLVSSPGDGMSVDQLPEPDPEPTNQWDSSIGNYAADTLDGISHTEEETSNNLFIKTDHPNIPQVFGQGLSFIDTFNRDEYAPQRTSNIFYPFASQDEWELAAYLLKSNLSMAAINAFLKLAAVGTCGKTLLQKSSLISSSRYRSLASLLKLQKTYEAGVKFCLQDPNGYKRLYRPIFLPRDQSSSTIGTQ